MEVHLLWDNVAVILIAIFVVVVFAEGVSAYVRNKVR